jgi:hypothetical protein
VRSESLFNSPYSTAMAQPTMKKCSPLQPPAISREPAGRVKVLPEKYAGIPTVRSSMRTAKVEADCSNGFSVSHSGTAKYRNANGRRLRRAATNP